MRIIWLKIALYLYFKKAISLTVQYKLAAITSVLYAVHCLLFCEVMPGHDSLMSFQLVIDSCMV